MIDRRRLLVSLFNPEEVRAAVAGGADVIDCEDATAKVGMFRPRTIGDIAIAVRQNDREGRCRISANIGFEPRLYVADPKGRAVSRSLDETMAKVGQEVLGIAAAMDTGDHRPNIVKCGIDGIPREWLTDIVAAGKSALRESSRYQDHQLVVGILETDGQAWNARKSDAAVIERLVRVGQFVFDPDGPIDLGQIFRTEAEKAELARLMLGVATSPQASPAEPVDPASLNWPQDARERLKMAVDAVRAGGGDGVMIDTPVTAKLANIVLLQHGNNPPDPGAKDEKGAYPRFGVFDIKMLQWFSEYCAYNQLETWLAGSINAADAAALGALEHVDVVLNRGTSSELNRVLYPTLAAEGAFDGAPDARFSRRIRAANVISMANAVRQQQG